MAELPPFTPDVIIGGAPRSGTTFLCEVLAKHPGIFIPRPFVPEPKVCLTPDAQGRAGLLARYRILYEAAPPGAIRIEKTANYFENDAACRRLADLLPETKLIFLLREPVARAYSNWRWSRKNGLETLPFAEAIAREGERASPFPPERDYVRPFDYMTRGRYGTFAAAWIEAFGRERIAFYLLEPALAEAAAFADDVQRFIGVPRLPWARLTTGRVNATGQEDRELDPVLEHELRERLAPEVRRFAEISGVDVAIWGY